MNPEDYGHTVDIGTEKECVEAVIDPDLDRVVQVLRDHLKKSMQESIFATIHRVFDK